MDGADDLDDVAWLLDDDCAQTILARTLEEPMSAPELTEVCEASRATVYRRLGDLSDRGLVSERTEPDADGHHRTVYVAALDRVVVDLTGDGFEVTVTRRERAADRFTDFVEGLYD
ncbi:MAG: ArsR/SmtB family transcription factor [Haloarculaceae archaeon]